MSSAIVEQQWHISSSYGSEKVVIREAASIIAGICPEEERIEDMMTAIAEACLNAIEHGNRCVASLPVTIRMVVDHAQYKFRIFDQGADVPAIPSELPIAAKWQFDHPRGWGLYLMKRLADHIEYGQVDGKVYVDLIFQR